MGEHRPSHVSSCSVEPRHVAPDWLTTADAADRVREDWRALRTSRASSAILQSSVNFLIVAVMLEPSSTVVPGFEILLQHDPVAVQDRNSVRTGGVCARQDNKPGRSPQVLRFLIVKSHPVGDLDLRWLGW